MSSSVDSAGTTSTAGRVVTFSGASDGSLRNDETLAGPNIDLCRAGFRAFPDESWVVGKRTICLMAVAILASLVAAPSADAARSDARPPTLGRINRIHASHTGYTEVTIPRPAQLAFEFFHNPDVKLEGVGRFIGLFLRQQGARHPAGIYATQDRLCYKAACDHGMKWFTLFPENIKWKKTLTIPAGTYRMYVVTDGAPVDVELRLHGLHGRRTFSPKVYVDSKVLVTKAEVGPNNAFVGGSTYRMPSAGAAFLSFWVESSAAAAEAETDCLYKGRPPVPDALAYSPGCQAMGAQAGAGAGWTTPPFVAGGGGGSTSIDTRIPAGTWSYGGTFAGAEKVDFADFVSAWVAYD